MSPEPRQPGWYPDPARPGRQRWWDGSEWSDARAYAVPTGPATEGRVDGYAVTAVISALLFLPVIPIVFGVLSRRRIARAHGFLSGDGLALGGIGLGVVVLLIYGVALALFLTEDADAASYFA